MRALITSLLAIFCFTVQAQVDTFTFLISKPREDVVYKTKPNLDLSSPLETPWVFRFINEVEGKVFVSFKGEECKFPLSNRENDFTVTKSGLIDCIIFNAQVPVCTLSMGELRGIKFKFEHFDSLFDAVAQSLRPGNPNPPPVAFVSRQTALMMQAPWKETSKNTSLIQLNVLKKDIIKPKKLKVGAMVDFHITHYNPYRDSVRISPIFADHHPNAEQKFESMLKERLLGATPAAKEEPKTTDPDGAPSRSVENSTLAAQANAAIITSFYTDMTSLYESLYTQPTLNPDSLDIGILRIDNAIAMHFDLAIVSPSSIEAKGNEWINNLAEAEREKVRQQLKVGLDTYKKIKSYNHLSNFPEQVENLDYTELTYKIKRGEQWGPDHKIKIRNTGGSGFGYSVGLMGTGLRDFEYGLKRISTYRTPPGTMLIDTVYFDSIYQTDNGKFNIGPLVLGHFYTRVPWLGGFNAAISTGLGVNTQLDNHYFLGASLMLGRKNNLVLSGGWVWAKVKRMEAKYQVGELLPEVKGITNSVPTRQVWESGYFFSVSWQM